MEKNVYFISGIDTDAGKSYCTAYYACQLIGSGKRVITQKFIQTGMMHLNREISYSSSSDIMTEEISISEKPVVNYTVREMKAKSF